MAGKSGGSWKVAYADFVTAMMAFFLVMWIGAQDQKTRQSVANYFVDPSGVDKRPAKSGAALNQPTYGSMPDQDGSALPEKGSSSPSPSDHVGAATRLVMNWIAADPQRLRSWKEKAAACREAAANSPAVQSRTEPAEKAAVRSLSAQLSATFTGGSPAKANDVYQDLVMDSLRQVNWAEVAQELLGR